MSCHLALFADFQDRRCLVVGAGLVAGRKIQALVRAGAAVHVVAPDACADVQELAQAGKISWHRRKYRDADLDGVALAVVASDDAALNDRIARQAREAGIWVNAAHDASAGDILLPSVVDREPVQVAISTGGASPVLGRLLRNRIETSVPGGFGRLASLVEEYRARTAKIHPERRMRRRFWEAVLDGPVAEQVLAGEEAQAREMLERELDAGTVPEGGEVYLVGAGPGDPDLLTFRALRLMQRADVVVYDRLVSEPILGLLRADSERIYAGKERSRHTLPQESINDLLVRLAREGKRVLRLKGGDPFVFGRGGEEISSLMREGVAFQIVPGITAANGAASYAGIPLTHRDHAQACIFCTGHLKDGSVDLNWKVLAHEGQTLVFYMGLQGCPVICAELIRHGMPEDTPAALITHGTLPDQRVLTGTLSDLPELVRREDVKPPTLIIIGQVVRLREQLRWYHTDTDVGTDS